MEVVFNGNLYKKNARGGKGMGGLCFEIFQYFIKKSDLDYKSLQLTFNQFHSSNKYIVLSEEDWKEKTEDTRKRYFAPVPYKNLKLYFFKRWANHEKGAKSNHIDNMIAFAVEQGYDIKF